MKFRVIKMPPSPAALRLASTLTGSDNRRICGSLPLAQICSAHAPQTSHIPRTLSEIAGERISGGNKNGI